MPDTQQTPPGTEPQQDSAKPVAQPPADTAQPSTPGTETTSSSTPAPSVDLGHKPPDTGPDQADTLPPQDPADTAAEPDHGQSADTAADTAAEPAGSTVAGPADTAKSERILWLLVAFIPLLVVALIGLAAMIVIVSRTDTPVAATTAPSVMRPQQPLNQTDASQTDASGVSSESDASARRSGADDASAQSTALADTEDRTENAADGTGSAGHDSGSSLRTVIYTVDGFSPETLVIDAGETVVFVNFSEQDFWPASNNHPSHELLPGFDPMEVVPADESWRFTFNKPGEWGYHNHLNPDEGGVISVSLNNTADDSMDAADSVDGSGEP